MTLDCLKLRGVPARAIDERHWEVEEAPIRGRELSVEPDLSNAAPFLSAAAVTGGKVGIPDWPTRTTQVGARFPGLLTRLGAEVEQDQTGLFVRGTGTLHGIEIDLGEAGELVPTFSAVLALADSPSTIRGVGHLRGHETNRLRAIVEDLRALGGRAEELEDGLRITPVPLHGGLWKAYGDHRMATAGALLGLVVPGVVVDDIASTTKTLPNFTDLWTGMLAA
jgi:3-phosphoshikimate 1-carboxyvinyltransferase